MGKGMYLGIEIGGTKLQLGVGDGYGGQLVELARHDVNAQRGAAAILEEIDRSAAALVQKYAIKRVGFGFGGPVDSVAGTATKSHQVAGWEGFPVARWCKESIGRPAVIGNDCDVAALAEARYGAGSGAGSVFYVTVGTGIGGGLVLNGRLHGAGRPAASEIGHLRPGLAADQPEATVESLASGPAIAAAALARMTGRVSRPLETVCSPAEHPSRQQVRKRLADVHDAEQEEIADLAQRCGGDGERLTAKLVAEAASEGNEIARQVLDHACQALGWAIAQVITLIAPEVVVVGGGVSLIGEPFFFAPLRSAVDRYVFPPLAGSFKIVPAGLGELAVVYGAIVLAADKE